MKLELKKMSELKRLNCFYATNGLNFKNSYATVCPIQSDQAMQITNEVPSQIFNSDGFKELRKKLFNGEWPSGCHLCKEAEADNNTSMRNDFTYLETNESLIDYITGFVNPKGLQHIEFRFSNSCNMACLHCDQVYSSGWQTKLKHYTPDQQDFNLKFDQLTNVRHMVRDRPPAISKLDIKMSQIDAIVDDLIKNFPNLWKIDMSGGEVLKQKQFFYMLDRLSEHPNAKQMWIFFYTNFNADFDPAILANKLAKFGQTTINISVDAGKNIYNYFRDGSWDKLKENIDMFNKVDKNTQLKAVITTSVYQMMDLEDIYKSVLTLDVDMIDSAIVYNPEYLNPSIIKHEFLNYVKNDISNLRIFFAEEEKRRCKDKRYDQGRGCFNDHITGKPLKGMALYSAISSLNRIEEYVMNHNTPLYDWERFKVFSPKIDKIWKKNFNNAFTKYQFVDEKFKRILK
jgi:MoaA/NifB/PqqE/SkfB family radical SAM enzyme